MTPPSSSSQPESTQSTRVIRFGVFDVEIGRSARGAWARCTAPAIRG